MKGVDPHCWLREPETAIDPICWISKQLMKTFITTRCRESLGGPGSVPMVNAFTRKSIRPKISGSRTWTNNNVLRFHMLDWFILIYIYIYIDLYWFILIYIIDLYVGSLQYFSISEPLFCERSAVLYIYMNIHIVQIHVHKLYTLYIHNIKLISNCTYSWLCVNHLATLQIYSYIHCGHDMATYPCTKKIHYLCCPL